MRNSESNSGRWYFVPVKPEIIASLRRWNIVVMVILAMLVTGMFMLAAVPHGNLAGSSAGKVSLKVDR